jgi:hypothetical protein
MNHDYAWDLAQRTCARCGYVATADNDAELHADVRVHEVAHAVVAAYNTSPGLKQHLAHILTAEAPF